jgi:hypothetical protein
MASKKTKVVGKMLAWRRKQRRGAIMKPDTFKKIERSAEAKGLSAESAKKVAGKAYWNTAKAKFAGKK